ncbi:DUF2190 family protein [Zavarzinella formosa]|uniref:DUF2190 family protein n=1 Tax=Zavarzinella formosa TaxID=360055 RepID=UPI000304B9C7|nr:DUF2190 family protein [Zavarzinella formosa]
MSQTPALFYQDGDSIDYTPVSAVRSGDVVLVGTVPMISPLDIAAGVTGALRCDGAFRVPKNSDAFTAGDAVYWDADGTPVTGTALSGAAGASAALGYQMGFAIADAASGDSYVIVRLLGQKSSFGTMPRIQTATVAAAGSVQGDAAAVAEGFTLVTGADATKGVLLPTAAAGKQVIIKNADVANAILKIWPATGDAVNAVAVNSAFSIAAKTSVLLVAYDATTWYSVPLLPS